MKEDKYTKGITKNQVCALFQMRNIRKNGLPKFIKLCMETPCWCPFQGHQYGRRIPTETSVFELSYLCVNSSLEKLITIKVIFIVRQGIAKSSKIVNVFNPHKSSPGHQLNTASRKSLEIQAPSLAKRRTLSNQKFVYIKVFRRCNTS